MGICSGVAIECIVISPQCPSYTNWSQDFGSAEAVSLELSEDMFPNNQTESPSAMGKNEANNKGQQIWKRKPWQYHLILDQAVSEDEVTCRVPDTWAYWLSGNRALPNSCSRLLLRFNNTNHECYKISVETKIAIGWIDQKTSEMSFMQNPKGKGR